MKEGNKTDWKKVMPYNRNEYNLLLKLLKNKEIATALSYLVSFKKHNKLDVISKEHSIELSIKDMPKAYDFQVISATTPTPNAQDIEKEIVRLSFNK